MPVDDREAFMLLSCCDSLSLVATGRHIARAVARQHLDNRRHASAFYWTTVSIAWGGGDDDGDLYRDIDMISSITIDIIKDNLMNDHGAAVLEICADMTMANQTLTHIHDVMTYCAGATNAYCVRDDDKI